MSGQQVIDVDAPVFVDLTQVITIDLTSESQSSPPRGGPKSPPRKRVVYTPKNASPTNGPRKLYKAGPSNFDDTAALGDQLLNSPSTSRTKREFIDIDSDDEDAPDHKKFKREFSESSDEEEAYARYHAGFDLNNEDLWKPVKVNKDKITFDVPERMRQATSYKPFIAPPHRSRPDISQPHSVSYTKPPKWKCPGARVIYRFPSPIQAIHPSRIHMGHWQPPVRSFKHVTSFKAAAGSITQIQQSKGHVVISSATAGGQADQPDEELNPYNKDGTILVWDKDVHTLSSHSREWGSSETKHYTVHDVKFDPGSSSFVSSGNDKSVHIWEFDEEANLFYLANLWRYQYVPHDLAFKPGESILAVGERKLMIYSNITSNASFSSVSPCPNRRTKHTIGAITWGHESSASYVYASSEPMDDSLIGYHGAFDATANKLVYNFDDDGAGDAITVTKDGERLALLTRHENPTNLLQIYDIRRANPEAILTTRLDPFSRDVEGEVTSADFSPDGIYLALGRNDNHTHIYDSRMLHRVIFDYEHRGPSRTNPGAQSYGIVQVCWVEKERTRPMGLITGGDDGCVRFWDPLRAPKHPNNGIVLAEMSSDVAGFSVGDHYQGEHPLVVGDCAGEVAVFDNYPGSFHCLYPSCIRDWSW